MSRAPAASSEQVRRQMASQPRRDTLPELALRRVLFARGLRFRVHVAVAGARPDVVFTRAKIAVFVMGDFWHSCPVHGTRPKANAAWWAEKLAVNQARDQRQRHRLEAEGWLVLWVWECEDAEEAASRVISAWRKRIDALATGGH